MDDVSLKVGGKVYSGWESVTVKRTLKAISGSFDLLVTDRWTDLMEPWPIQTGDECQVSVGSQALVTGYVDRVGLSCSAAAKSITVTGRDKTADLVDCSAIYKTSSLSRMRLEQMATTLAKPFGIKVSASGSTGPRLDDLSINPGDKIFEVIEKKARERGFLLVGDGLGNIQILRPSGRRSASDLAYGTNILTFNAEADLKDRYSDYTISYTTASTSDDPEISQFTVKAKAKDPAITRHRPLVMAGDGEADQATAQKRINWEAAIRVARSLKLTVTVPGWKQESGDVWEINTVTRVTIPWLKLKQEPFLISEVTLSKSNNGGTITSMLLESPDAYNPDPTLWGRRHPLQSLYLNDQAQGVAGAIRSVIP